MPEIKLSCECGNVQGKTHFMTATSGNRITCCCADCQAFANYLEHLGRGNATPILDQFLGTDIFQMPISKLAIHQGVEEIACVRLTRKGMYRWYTRCCHTPIGNTLGANMPFIGVIHNFMKHDVSRVEDIGKNRAYVHTKGMKDSIPKILKGSSLRAVLRSVMKLLIWKIQGLNRPSVFFDEEGKAIAKPIIKSD